MNKLIKTIEKISDLGPDVRFQFNTQGLQGIYWKARVEVNYTDLFDEKDFDKVGSIPAIEQLYIMEEISEYPHRAIENITRRLKDVYKKMDKE